MAKFPFDYPLAECVFHDALAAARIARLEEEGEAPEISDCRALILAAVITGVRSGERDPDTLLAFALGLLFRFFPHDSSPASSNFTLGHRPNRRPL